MDNDSGFGGLKLSTLLQNTAILMALLYALGWVCESAMLRDLSIGNITVSHEQAIAGGVAAFVCVFPALLSIWIFCSDKKLHADKADSLTAGALVFALGTFIAGVTPLEYDFEPRDAAIIWLRIVSAFAILGFVIYRLGGAKRRRTDAWRPILGIAVLPIIFMGLLNYMQDDRLIVMQELLFPDKPFRNALYMDGAITVFLCSLIYACAVSPLRTSGDDIVWPLFRPECISVLGLVTILKFDNFSNNLLPCMASMYGGFLAQDQYMEVNDKDHRLSDSNPCMMEAFVLERDSDTILFAHGYEERDFQFPHRPLQASNKAPDFDNCKDKYPGRMMSISPKDVVWVRKPQSAAWGS